MSEQQAQELERVIEIFRGALSDDFQAALTAGASALRGQAQGCKWTEDTDGGWEGSCGAAWVFECAGPEENKMKFCPSCGRALVLR